MYQILKLQTTKQNKILVTIKSPRTKSLKSKYLKFHFYEKAFNYQNSKFKKINFRVLKNRLYESVNSKYKSQKN